jgi:hypothetical protein
MVSGFWNGAYPRLARADEAGTMTDKARIRIAGAVTVFFLAGISAAGLALRDQPPRPTAAPITRPAATAAAEQPVGAFDDEAHEDE